MFITKFPYTKFLHNFSGSFLYLFSGIRCSKKNFIFYRFTEKLMIYILHYKITFTEHFLWFILLLFYDRLSLKFFLQSAKASDERRFSCSVLSCNCYKFILWELHISKLQYLFFSIGKIIILQYYIRLFGNILMSFTAFITMWLHCTKS